MRVRAVILTIVTVVTSVAGLAGGALVRGAGADLTPSEIEAVLAVARGDAAGRARFHAPYIVSLTHPTLERVEVVTERRRLLLIAEEKLAGGDRLFAFGTLRAEEALRPWRGRLTIAAHLRFPPQNAYAMAPPVEVRLRGAGGDVPRLTTASETILGLASGVAGAALPVVGAKGEARFDDTSATRAAREAVVLLDGRELARVAVDLSRMP